MANSENLQGDKNVKIDGTVLEHVNLTGNLKDPVLLAGLLNSSILEGMQNISLSGKQQTSVLLNGQLDNIVNLIGSVGSIFTASVIRASSTFVLASSDTVKASNG